MDTTSKSRTLKAYVAELLVYPRWIIECEVDFTHCPHDAHYNEFLPDCVDCQFGRGCRWLNRHRTPDTSDAPVDDLVAALGAAVEYLESTSRERTDDYADTRAWLRDSRNFLKHNDTDSH